MNSRIGSLVSVTALAILLGNSPNAALAAKPTWITPPPNLVAWWAGENNPDENVGGLNGSLAGGTSYGRGMVGQAFQFNGGDAVVLLPNSRLGALDLTNNRLSIEAWMYLTSWDQPRSELQMILDKYWSGGRPNGYSFYVEYGVLTLTLAGVSNHVLNLSQDTLLPLNVWTHVAATYDGAVARLYLNGAEVGSQPFAENLLHNDADAAIGNDSGGTRNYGFNGLLDEVCVYDRALTAAEIQALSTAGSGGKYFNPPTVLGAATLVASGAVGLRFDQLLDPATATNPANYQVSYGASVGLVTLRSDGKSLTLYASNFVYTNFTAVLSNVRNVGGNPLASNTVVPVMALRQEAQDVGIAGDPLEKGSSFSSDGSGFDEVGGGSDIWNQRDGAHFLFEPKEGDFDLRAKVIRLDQKATWTFAGLHARESLYPGSAGLKVIVTSPQGANTYKADYRATTDASSSEWTGGGQSAGSTIPNAWLRLSRQGTNWTAYRGTNGVDWVQFARMGRAYANRMWVGLAPCPVNNSAGQATTAWFRNYTDAVTTNDAPIAMPDLLVKNRDESEAAASGDNLYLLAPAPSQMRTQAVLPNLAAVYQVRVQNDGTEARPFNLRASETTESGWETTYLLDGTNVSAQILGATGFTTPPVGPTASILVTVQVKPSTVPLPGTTKTVVLRAYTDLYSANTRDVVQVTTAALPYSLPDLSVRRDFDLNYTGVNVFNASGFNQTAFLEVEPGQSARYLVQLRNYGNITNRFALTGTGGTGGWMAGFAGGRPALNVNGSSQYVTITNAPGLRPASVTLEGWFNFSAVGGCRVLVGKTLGTGTSDSYVIWHDGSQLRGSVEGTGSASSIGWAWTPTLGTWYHLAFTFDGSSKRQVIYVDGIPRATNTVGVTITYDNHPLLIGADINNEGFGCFFAGQMNEVRVWGVARSAAELQADLGRRLTGDEPGLLGLWQLDEGLGPIAVDSTVNHNTGNLVNGPSWGWLPVDLRNLADITLEATSAGWSNLVLPPNAAVDLWVQVTPDASVPGGSVRETLLTATSLWYTNPPGLPGAVDPVDALKTVTTLLSSSGVPQGGTYTTTDQFLKGQLNGVDCVSASNQCQLSQRSSTFRFIWVPNSNEGTVSKVDTLTGREIARYRTCPAGVDSQPSRTTVDQFGNCWVANRNAGTVVKIGLYENGQYVDRNGDGIITTSQDVNNDGDITGTELLPWGQDECVLYEVVVMAGKEGTFTPGAYTGGYAGNYWNPGPRGLAMDAQNNVWIGTHDTMKFYYLDGTTAAIMRTVSVASVNHTSYGAFINAQGLLWSSGYKDSGQNNVLWLNPADNSFGVLNFSFHTYGIWFDRNNHLFLTGYGDSKLARVNMLTQQVEWIKDGVYQSRGVVVTDDSDVWTADSSPGTVTRWSNDGYKKATLSVGSTPTGVSVDADGKVWVVNNGDEYVKRIDPALNQIDLSKRIIGGLHYGYSDMTGNMIRNATTRLGTWTMIHNSTVLNTPWGVIAWESAEPPGTSIRVRARSSNHQEIWSVFETAVNGSALHATPPGKYLEIEVTLQTMTNGITPVLYGLTVTPAMEARYGVLAYTNGFETAVGPEWSTNSTATTPTGGRAYLGPFGNQTVTLALSNLPPHRAITVTFDTYVLGSWDGNNTNTGPDVWELNLAGGLKLAHTTFNNAPSNSVADGQAYPGQHPGGQYPARSGAGETNSLGFNVPELGVMDTVYPQLYSFPHTAGFLVLNWLGSGLSGTLADEAWGLDNVRIYLVPDQGPPVLKPLGFGAGGFTLQMQISPGWTYTLEASSDLSTWTSLSTNRNPQTNLWQVADPAAPAPQRFYRGVQKP